MRRHHDRANSCKPEHYIGLATVSEVQPIFIVVGTTVALWRALEQQQWTVHSGLEAERERLGLAWASLQGHTFSSTGLLATLSSMPWRLSV